MRVRSVKTGIKSTAIVSSSRTAHDLTQLKLPKVSTADLFANPEVGPHHKDPGGGGGARGPGVPAPPRLRLAAPHGPISILWLVHDDSKKVGGQTTTVQQLPEMSYTSVGQGPPSSPSQQPHQGCAHRCPPHWEGTQDGHRTPGEEDRETQEVRTIRQVC